MNGTSGMRLKMAQASFGPVASSRRVARAIHTRTTARGWMKQTMSSRSFFIFLNLPIPMPRADRPLAGGSGCGRGREHAAQRVERVQRAPAFGLQGPDPRVGAGRCRERLLPHPALNLAPLGLVMHLYLDEAGRWQVPPQVHRTDAWRH